MRKNKKIQISLQECDLIHTGLAIYLISTISFDGINNIAPYAMVMSVSYNPLTFAISSDKDRDTYRNILQTKEFVLNIPSTTLLKEIDITGTKFPDDVDEFLEANLTPIPSIKVKPPSIKECKAHIECKLKNIFEINKKEVIIIAKAISISIDKGLCLRDFAQQKRLLDPIFAIRPNKGKVFYFSLGRFVGKM